MGITRKEILRDLGKAIERLKGYGWEIDFKVRADYVSLDCRRDGMLLGCTSGYAIHALGYITGVLDYTTKLRGEK